MKSRSIKYVSYFDFQDSPVKRGYVTAATNKMESICESLNAAGYDVEIVSMSPVVEDKFRVYRGRRIKRRDGLTLKLFSSWGGNGKILRGLRMLWHLLNMFLYLCFHTRKGEPVLVYHSQGYFNIILWAKKIRKFKLILEVEEIYQDVSQPKFEAMARYEHKMFEAADAFIFPTLLLNDKLNTRGLPYVIIHGTYKVEPQAVEKFADGKIHVIYAGTFDPRKGGAAAAAAAAHLPENYHLHICGFGDAKGIAAIQQVIADTQARSRATVTYDGLKLGRDYIEFLQQCHIGLSTQDPSAAFNATSFPSKILSYMANGLAVVSIDIPAVTTSAVGPYLNYYHEQTPEEIARAITLTDTNQDNREVIRRLMEDFNRDISTVI